MINDLTLYNLKLWAISVVAVGAADPVERKRRKAAAVANKRYLTTTINALVVGSERNGLRTPNMCPFVAGVARDGFTSLRHILATDAARVRHSPCFLSA